MSKNYDETLDLSSSTSLIQILGSAVAAGMITHARHSSKEVRQLETNDINKLGLALERAAANAETEGDQKSLQDLAIVFRSAGALITLVDEAES